MAHTPKTFEPEAAGAALQLRPYDFVNLRQGGHLDGVGFRSTEGTRAYQFSFAEVVLIGVGVVLSPMVLRERAFEIAQDHRAEIITNADAVAARIMAAARNRWAKRAQAPKLQVEMPTAVPDYVLTIRVDPFETAADDEMPIAEISVNVSEMARQLHGRLYGREPDPEIDWQGLDE